MKTKTLLILLFLSIQSNAQFFIPQLKAGVYINDSIGSFTLGLNGCTKYGPNYQDVGISADTSLVPVVSGVALKLIVTRLTTLPDSAYTGENGILHLYDTLTFTSAKPTFTFYSSPTSFGQLDVKLMVAGMPMPHESYPCQFGMNITLPQCLIGMYVSGYPPYCSVEDFNGVNESPLYGGNFKLTPNPAFEYVEINSSSNVSHEQLFKLFNMQGQEIFSEQLPLNFKSKQIRTDWLAAGIYFWNITGEAGFKERGKLIINKRE